MSNVEIKKDNVMLFVFFIAFTLGVVFSFIEGGTIYTIGVSFLSGIGLLNFLFDLFLTLPIFLKKKSSPSQEISTFIGKSIDGKEPIFDVKFEEKGYAF